MEWSKQQIARLAGTTSRTLRHYDRIGLVPPTRIGASGFVFGACEPAALARVRAPVGGMVHPPPLAHEEGLGAALPSWLDTARVAQAVLDALG